MLHRFGLKLAVALAGALVVSGCMTQLLLSGGALAATRLLGGPEWRHPEFAGALFRAAAPAEGDVARFVLHNVGVDRGGEIVLG